MNEPEDLLKEYYETVFTIGCDMEVPTWADLPDDFKTNLRGTYGFAFWQVRRAADNLKRDLKNFLGL